MRFVPLTLLLLLPVITFGADPWVNPWTGHAPPTAPGPHALGTYPVGQPRTYIGDHLQYVAMPIGGIGTGTIWLDGQGRLSIWQINNTYSEARVPNSLLAVRAQSGEGKPATRILQTVEENGLPPFTALQYEGGYPLARLQFTDAAFPVSVRLEGFNPMIPTDAADSAIPCAIYRVTARNTGAQPARVQVLGSLANIAYSQFPKALGTQSGGNRNDLLRDKEGTVLFLHRDSPADLEGLLEARDADGKRLDAPQLCFLPSLNSVEQIAGIVGGDQVEAMGQVIRNGGGLVIDGASPQFFADLRRARERMKQFQALEVFEDFEKPAYDGWTVTGNAFAVGPASGSLSGQQPVSGYFGYGLVNSYRSGDGPQGEMLSKKFTINKRYIGLLVGGGNHPGVTCVNLLVGGKVVLSATGKNREQLDPATWDVASYQGQDAQIQLVDHDSGGWGHINVDHIVFADTAPDALLSLSPAEVLCTRLPIPTGTATDAATAGLALAAKDPVLAAAAEKPPFTHYTKVNLADFPGFTVLASASNGDPLIISGPAGKATLVLSLTPDLPVSWIHRLLTLASGRALPADARFVSTSPCAGSLALSTPDIKAVAGNGPDAKLLLAGFAETGRVPESREPALGEAGQLLTGAMTVALDIPPGEERTATFVISWHFPNVERYGHPGNLYATRFTDALAVARYVDTNLPALYGRTAQYHDTVYQSNLPAEWLDAMTSQSVIFRGPTCWWAADSYFAGYEGSYTSCPLNCTHVWNYAQAHARLFPEVGRNMRVSDLLVYLHANGETSHRQHAVHGAFIDGQCAAIMDAYREYQLSPDPVFLIAIWPNLKKATDWLIARIDADHDGVPAGRQPNTYDCDVSGANTFIGSQYLAALAAAERMAVIMKEPDTAQRWKTIREAGMANQDAKLWNGEYYLQLPDTRANDYGTGCHSDQLLGQWWANQVNLGALYPKAHVRAALESIMKNNFREGFAGFKQFPRPYVIDKDSGLLICTWPKGGRPEPFTIYSDEVWTGIEYAVAGEMIAEGMIDQARKIVSATRNRYDGIKRDGLNSGPGGNPFNDLECGKFYARAMSSWGLLIASQGLILDGPAGVLGFAPKWQPKNHRSFFTAPTGWGLFVQTRTGATQSERIELRYGTVRLNELVFAVPDGAAPKAVVKVNAQPITAALKQDGAEIHLALAKTAVIKENDVVTVNLNW